MTNKKVLFITLTIVYLNIFVGGESLHKGQGVKQKSNEDLKHKSEPVKNTSRIFHQRSPVTTIAEEPGCEKLDKYKLQVAKKRKLSPKIIQLETVKKWANEISKQFVLLEDKFVRSKELAKEFKDVKMKTRNGSAIIDKVSSDLEDLFQRRAKSAENIMRKTEELAKNSKNKVPGDYHFDRSKNLDKMKLKLKVDVEDEYYLPENCSSRYHVPLNESQHFNANVSLDISSVHVVQEVFECDPLLVNATYYTEGLLQTFRSNYEQDATLGFQYFCSATGFLRHYPAASWESMERLTLKDEELADVFDCRLRPWYVSASGAPRDVLILVDASGSMKNSSNQVVAEVFTQTLLNALTDDDRVNVLRFNVLVESPIGCFNNTLVPANHVNTAAMMDAMKDYHVTNETWMNKVLEYGVGFLQNQSRSTERSPSCQQAIVILTDSLYLNYSELLSEIDPGGNIRLFILWLHDINGLRDNTEELAGFLSCYRDGSFAELLTQSDVTLQVLKILQVMERPLVYQRTKRLSVFSDLYAHIEDPRKGEYHWHEKENSEQYYRYIELMRNKTNMLNNNHTMADHMLQQSLNTYGHYYEGEDLHYDMLITVSVPVFDHITVENITIMLNTQKEQYSTRTYPVNRLLGVAGVDIPIDHLKLMLPFYEVGSGGTVFLLDHRGKIVLHENLKPLLDGDILKPGYRTVDFLDLEQPSTAHRPRHYPPGWLKFRRMIVIDEPKGSRVMFGKNVFDSGMRAFMEEREYHWRRVIDHYTLVVVLPPYGRQQAVPDESFTQKLAQAAYAALDKTDYSVHPDWLYCRYVDSADKAFIHFVERRMNEINFTMEQRRHHFIPFSPTNHQKSHICEEKLMARVCHDAIATEVWSREHEDPGVKDCSYCALGSVTAFIATESGLTRWQKYHATSSLADPPEGDEWSRSVSEPWYRRAVRYAGKLVLHAPALPIRRMRNIELPPTLVGTRAEWFTAARTLSVKGKGTVGVAGFHFYPAHLEKMIQSITNFPCTEENEDKCEAKCDGISWDCVLVDDEGWLLAGGPPACEDSLAGDGIRQHLSTAHPIAMTALLNESVFNLHWIHDYQGVCFPKKPGQNAAMLSSSLLRSMARSMTYMLQITSRALLYSLALLWQTISVNADTQFDRDKRSRRMKKDFAREKYETLYDDRVLVNRTFVTACDRSRPIYELQTNPKALAALNKPFNPTTWPLVASLVEDTNVLLIAVYTLCPYDGRPIPNPMINERVDMSEADDYNSRAASRLACWRNRVPLPGRQPNTACFPHKYEEEEGYRQCGPWLPDPQE